MIYRLGIGDDGDEHLGYRYFASKAAAIKGRSEAMKEFGVGRCAVHDIDDGVFRFDNFTIDTAETPKTKSDIIALLNRWGGHPDNG